MTSDYRLAPQLAARMLGLSLIALGALVFVAAALVVIFALPVVVLSVVVVVCVVGVFATGWLLNRRAYIVRATDDGFRVRFVRGAGVRQARWIDVEEAVTDTIAGAPCVVLRLRDGRTTTIPVEVLAIDREQFVRELQEHLAGHPREGRGRR
ncbi:hypothetical protein ncot_00675 [Nocardioides sp. JQ2195]|uniref:hypothetical protein n=1 Tax=Nocardioides sp. JQ2195 TaxID=2592334 RepID=UPI00143ED109|nr:hypothetical protein [Nocardioides sp. JQ2195]QIX25263.1 hypothetical protein ncot_00675 [Nocardioides sp. JQ2195]